MTAGRGAYSGDPGSIVAGLCGILHPNFGEFVFHAPGRIKQDGLGTVPPRVQGDRMSGVALQIAVIGVLAGAFGGATLARPLADALRAVPALEPYAGPLAFGTVVVAITYLSLIIGELVPKRLALNGAEAVASRVAGPTRLLSAITAPAVW